MNVSFIGVWEAQACAMFKNNLRKEIAWMAMKVSPPCRVFAEAGRDGKYRITFQKLSATASMAGSATGSTVAKEVHSRDRDLCFALASCCHLYSLCF